VKLYPFIAAEKPAVRNVKKTCTLLSVSRSAFYQSARNEPSAHEQRDIELEERIEAIHEGSRRTYGAPRVHQHLRRDGIRTARKRVARLMARRGLAGRHRRRFKKTTIADERAVAAPDLVKRSFAAGQVLNGAWVGDITYLRTWEGWAYLATVIDLGSRRVVGFAVADHMRSSLVEEAIEMAVLSRRPAAGLIFHSDRGSQYTSASFRNLLERNGIRQSLSRPRQCWDNAVAESFFSTLKTELVYRQPMTTRAAARQAVFEYIEIFYNRQRLHSALGYRSPAEYERETQAPTLAASAA
jgi:transposase InsO family protein